MDQRELVSLKEVAQELGMKRPVLHHYINTLGIKRHAFKFDREVYISAEDVSRLKAILAEKKGHPDLISLKEAALQLGVLRTSLHHYLKHIGIQTIPKDFEREHYLRTEDFAAIKQIFDERARRKQPTQGEARTP